MSNWISVKDRLPKIDELVLLLFESGEIDIGACKQSFETGNFYFAHRMKTFLPKSHDLLFGKLTHWMPLPETPEDENEKR